MISFSQKITSDWGQFDRYLQEGFIKVPPSRFPDNDFKFLENQEFESQLFLFLTASENLNQNYYFPLRDKIQSLIQQVKDELNSNSD
ncbi:hypothetical protein ACPUEN_14365 [Algoriphagus yeomjeoni]|uniref:hypothetical protein n=1 Tax=Algoriphagus yeomjeoni TaxID=291403 RepID=UPI003CE52F7B